MLREVLAPNASAMTLDGTRTYVVGAARTVVIDPGPDDARHLDAVAELLDASTCVAVLLTHTHPDHAAGAEALAGRLRAPVRGIANGRLRDGDRIDTDAGPLLSLATPGHTPDHASFHWPAAAAVFCGDLMMGGLETALVAAPEGDLAAYLESLERLRSVRPRVLHPSHGPSFDSPDAAIGAYIEHRRARERQVLDALAAGATDTDDIVDHVYGGTLPHELRGVAVGAVHAYLQHLEATGRLQRGSREPDA